MSEPRESFIYAIGKDGRQLYSMPVTIMDGSKPGRYRFEPKTPADRRKIRRHIKRGGRIEVDPNAHLDLIQKIGAAIHEGVAEGFLEGMRDTAFGYMTGHGSVEQEERIAARKAEREAEEERRLAEQRARWTEQAPCPTCDCNDHVDDPDGTRTGCTIPVGVSPEALVEQRCVAGENCRCWGGNDRECEGCWLRWK